MIFDLRQTMFNSKKYLIPALTSILILWGLSFWVPVNFHAPSIYFGADNFHGIKPRAIIGSIIYLLPIDQANVNIAGNFIKFISLFFWLFFITASFYQSLLRKGDWLIARESIALYLALSFIFAASSLTYITFSASGIIDAFPAAIVALIVCSRYLTGNGDALSNASIPKIALITGLLVIATWSHEKSLYDIAILLVWFSMLWGIRKGLLYFAPALVLSAALIIRMAHKVTSGESLDGYIKILSSGLDFFWNYAFSVWGVIIGGGALWGLYWIASLEFIRSHHLKEKYWQRVTVIVLMLLICFLPLLVALDTSRICALIWLPVVLVMQQLNLTDLFRTRTRKLIVWLLCIFQILLPPALIYERGMAPFNCYGLWVGQFLVKRSEVNIQTRGPFDLSFHSRPDYTDFFSGQCNLR
jgi:hypothetical protein